MPFWQASSVQNFRTFTVHTKFFATVHLLSKSSEASAAISKLIWIYSVDEQLLILISWVHQKPAELGYTVLKDR